MTTIESFIIPLLMILIVSAFFCLGLWTYKDAQIRGQQAGLWTAIVLLTPNFIGLLLYFLIGRKEMIQCSACKTKLQLHSNYCSNCGEHASTTKNKLPVIKKGASKHLLILFVVLLVAATILFAGSLMMLNKNGNIPLFSSVSIGMLQNTWGDKWNISFKSYSGIESTSLRIKDGNPKKLYINSELESGSLALHIVQQDKVIPILLDQPLQDIEQDLTSFTDGKVSLRLNGENAKNGNINIWWE